MTTDEIRKAVQDDPEEEPGGEDFLADELIIAAVLGRAFLTVGTPLAQKMYKILEDEGTRSIDKAITAIEPGFKNVFDKGVTDDKVEAAIKRVLREGAGLAGSRSLLDDTFRIKEIIKDMTASTKYFTNNYFNKEVAPKLHAVVEKAAREGKLESEIFQAVRQAMDDRLHSVPYWRVVANSAASRSFHYGAVKAGMLAGNRAYKIVTINDSRRSKVCKHMDGKEFWLADAEVQVSRAAVAEDEDIKTVAPWLTNADVDGKTTAELKQLGFIMPPFHANCRSTIKFI